MTGVSIALLGEPQVSFNGAPVVCTSKKALGLFIYLALRGGRQPRRDLARLFWGGADEGLARTSLRSALQRLPAPLAACLAVDRELIGLHATVNLDTARFTALAGAQDVASLAAASQLYGGELLKNLDIDAAPEYDDWLHRERTRYRQLAQSVFDRLITRHRERAHADTAHASTEREAAIATARRWTLLEPAAEGAHRWLMQLFFDAGQRDAALAQYEVCQRELAVATGRGPNAQTRALFEAIAAGAGLSVPAAQARAQTLEPTVRAPEIAATSFFGRVDELAALEQLLSDPACRLVTLHALGGMGKSRLAFALALQVASRFALGATWVALDAVPSAAQMPHAVARALGLELPPHPDPGSALCAALRAQDRLLVLDNFEHLITDGAIDLVLSMLHEAPRLRLLVTSREVLGVQEEWVYAVPGLAYPMGELAQGGAPGEFPAVELFVQRARQAYVGFSAQAEWPHVVRICRLVQGLPLALELAAAWVRTIPCGDIAQAIETESAALASLHRNRPDRQHSLDAVVRTSWALLTPEQQQALAALSVFVGGFTQDAAHAVAQVSLRIMSALVDKSLVSRRADGRLGLHELVRQFAAAQLTLRSDEQRQVQQRFAGYFAAQLGRWRALLEGPNELDAEALLSLELPNVMAAAELWMAHGGEALDAVAEPLLRVLVGRGLMREALATANHLLDAKAPLLPSTRTLVLAYRGRVHAMLSKLPMAQQDFDAAIALGREHQLGFPLAYALLYAQTVAYIGDRLDVALRQIEELEPLLDRLDEPALHMRAHFNAGVILDAAGQPLEAQQRLRGALARATEVGSPSFLATVQSHLAAPMLKQGRLEEGEALLRQALGLYERIGSTHHVARVLNSLAIVTLWRFNGAQAASAVKDATLAHELHERVGYAPGQSSAQDTLGQALVALGRFDEARACFVRAASIGTPILQAEANFHLALLDLEQGQTEAATQAARALLDAARTHALDPIQRWAALLTAAIALRSDPRSAQAARWLRTLLADTGLDFDLKRHAQVLLTALPQGGSAEPNDAQPVGDLLAELATFLR